jgi:carbamoyl-phosphate synthase large subunit
MQLMLGSRLADLGYRDGLYRQSGVVAVKAPVFSMSKLLEVDSHLGPEMKSTGEVMGIDTELAPAMFKAFLGSLDRMPRSGDALITIADADKAEALPIVARLVEMGFALHATPGTSQALREAGVSVHEVAKIGEGAPDVLDLITGGKVGLVINTISAGAEGLHTVTGGNGRTHHVNKEEGEFPVAIRDGFEIRRAAVERRIPCLTSLDTAAALVESLNLLALGGAYQVKTLAEYLADGRAERDGNAATPAAAPSLPGLAS